MPLFSSNPHRVEPGDRPDPVIVESTDAIVRGVLACVCGSDLWPYRGESPFEPGPIGHEFIGVVEDVGADVASVKRGDFVIAPFAFSDGTCPHCRHGITSACVAGGFYPSNGDGGQGEAVRVPLADGSLVTVPGSGHSDRMLASLLTLSDVMSTGHHAAVCADVRPGSTVAVVGDGAVGLCGVLARIGTLRTRRDGTFAVTLDSPAEPGTPRSPRAGSGRQVLEVAARPTIRSVVCESLSVMLREFDARLQKGENPGAWTCVVMDDAAELFGTRGLVKIRGAIDGEPFDGALMAQGDGTHRLPVRAKIRKAIGKDAGDSVHVRIDERIG